MTALTRTFTVAELEEIGVPDVNLHEEVLEVDDHGTSLKCCIFRHDDQCWEIYYRAHGQNGITWDDDEIEATAVEERQVTVTQWLPVEMAEVTG